MPAIVLSFIKLLPLLISAAQDATPIIAAAKTVIQGWVDKGVITVAVQNALHAHMDALQAAALAGTEPPEFLVEADPTAEAAAGTSAHPRPRRNRRPHLRRRNHRRRSACTAGGDLSKIINAAGGDANLRRLFYFMKKILCLDGGGMRGYLAAAILADLEQRAGKPCCEIFDLMAGTSTGGIEVAGLGRGVPATEMLKFYVEDGPAIFGQPQPMGEYGIDRPRFSAATIEACLQRRLGLQTLPTCHTKVLMPAFDLTAQQLKVFKSYENTTVKLWEAARATSAAPSYFPAFTLGGMVLWDGGVMANNPAGLALADAINIWGKDEEFQILSIGTGRTPVTGQSAITAANLVNAGIVPIAAKLLETLFASTSQVTDYEMEAGLGYHRIQPDLPILFDLADARPASIQNLAAAAAAAIAKFSATLDSFA